MEFSLDEKQKAFPHLVGLLIDKCHDALGFEITFGEAWRSPEEAERLAVIGKGVKNSVHIERLAIDLLLFREGVYLTDSAQYKEAGEYWKSLSQQGRFQCCWGGDFSEPDGNHFSIEHNGVR